MLDNVIQFIPKPNPSRLTLLETEAVKEAVAAPIEPPAYGGVEGCKYWHEPGTADQNGVPLADESA